MKRIITLIAIGATVVAGCGSDSATSSPADSAAQATAPSSDGTDASTTVAPATTAAPATTGAPAAPATTAAPAPTSSLNANESRAAMAALAPADLPGWTQQPEEQDDDGNGLFEAPECAALKAVEDLPALQDDIDVTLIAPDGKVQLGENVTVGDAAGIQAAFDAFADPSTAACLTVAFTTVLQQPGALPDGVTMTGIQFAQQPLTAGDQAIGYVATITVTGTQTGVTAPLGVRFDAVRTGSAIAVLSTLSAPGAAPVDPAVIATAAGQKLTAAG